MTLFLIVFFGCLLALMTFLGGGVILCRKYFPELDKEREQEILQIAISKCWGIANYINDESVKFRALGALATAVTIEKVKEIEDGINRILSVQKEQKHGVRKYYRRRQDCKANRRSVHYFKDRDHGHRDCLPI